MSIRSITQHYNLRLALCSGLLTLSSFNYAFDNQGFAQTQAMQQFLDNFGDVYNAKKKSYAFSTWFTSLYNSLGFSGYAVGIIIGFDDLCALRSTMDGLHHVYMEYAIMVGRVMNQGYIGMELSVIPVLQSEMMPAPVRGFAVASYQMSICVGGLIMNVVCRGTSTIKSDAAWRIPFGLYFIVPSIVASGIFFTPESPRWLLAHGKDEQAIAALRRLRVHNDDTGIFGEVDSILSSLEAERDKGSYMDLIRGNNLRQTIICCALFFFLQGTCDAFASKYATLYISQLNTINPFSLSCVTYAGNTLASFVSMYLVDRTGRRILLIIGAAIQAIAMFVIAGLGTAKGTFANNSAIAAMITVFAVACNGTFAPIIYVVGSEIPEQRLRDKTQRIAGVLSVITNFTVTFSLPYITNAGYGNLGMKFGFIYAPVAVLAALFTFFYVPECKGRSLEEIDLLFEDKISALQSRHWYPQHVSAQLRAMAHEDMTGEANKKNQPEHVAGEANA